MRFHDWLLKYKLLGIFCTMSLLILIVGVIAHHVHVTMAESMQEMYFQRLVSTQMLTATYGRLKDLEVATQTIILGPANPVVQNGLAQKNHENLLRVEALLEEYEKIQKDELCLHWLADLRAELSAYRMTQSMVVKLAMSGIQADAYRYYMDNVALRHDNVNAILNMMVNRSLEIARRKNEESKYLSNMSLEMIAILLMISIALAVYFGRILTRLIVDPLTEILQEVEKVGAGNLQGLSDYLPIDSKDEIGQLSRGVRRMALALQKYLAQVEDQSRQIFSMAYLDPLTSLPNRRQFIATLSELLGERNLSNEAFAVMFIDINHFKEINDTMGHNAGDELLRLLGERLSAALGNGDMAARIGGDEFTVIFSKYGDRPQLEILLKKITRIFQEPFVLKGDSIPVGASIGISEFPRNGRDIDSLLNTADTAMFRSKHRSHRLLEFFSEECGEDRKRGDTSDLETMG